MRNLLLTQYDLEDRSKQSLTYLSSMQGVLKHNNSHSRQTPYTIILPYIHTCIHTCMHTYIHILCTVLYKTKAFEPSESEPGLGFPESDHVVAFF